jgi:hypothetical protein
MGHKSTLTISREEALSIISSANLEELSNEDLAEMVEAVLGGENHSHNYIITGDYP